VRPPTPWPAGGVSLGGRPPEYSCPAAVADTHEPFWRRSSTRSPPHQQEPCASWSARSTTSSADVRFPIHTCPPRCHGGSSDARCRPVGNPTFANTGRRQWAGFERALSAAVEDVERRWSLAMPNRFCRRCWAATRMMSSTVGSLGLAFRAHRLRVACTSARGTRRWPRSVLRPGPHRGPLWRSRSSEPLRLGRRLEPLKITGPG
jgi:hypothetical protein